MAMYHPHSHGPPTSLSLFKTKRPRRPLRQMPTKSPQSRPTAHATADAHVRCLPSPQTHSLGKILKNGSGRQEKSGENLSLSLRNTTKIKIKSAVALEKNLHTSQAPASAPDTAAAGKDPWIRRAVTGELLGPHAPSALLELSYPRSRARRVLKANGKPPASRGAPHRTRVEIRSGWDSASVGHLACLVQVCVKGPLCMYVCMSLEA